LPVPDNNAVVLLAGVTGICAIRPPVILDAGGETVTGLTIVRGAGRPVAFDVDLVAVTTGALTVVGVLVCLFGALTVEVFRAGWLVVVLVVAELLTRPELLDLLLDEAPLDPPPLDPPLDPPPLDPPPLDPPPPLDEAPPPLDPPPPPDLPAPADPVPERLATISTPFFFES